MPYIKPREAPFAKLRRLLRGYELNERGLSEILGCCWKTAQSRLNNPGEFTLDELARISRKAHIPFDEIRETIML